MLQLIILGQRHRDDIRHRSTIVQDLIVSVKVQREFLNRGAGGSPWFKARYILYPGETPGNEMGLGHNYGCLLSKRKLSRGSCNLNMINVEAVLHCVN